jgi:UDP-N-acetylglucosamine 2-epimerase (non-hydrolysing)
VIPGRSAPRMDGPAAGTARRRLVVSVVGTRPNFMKAAPVVAALARRPDDFRHVLVHTGQHYDEPMSQVFLEELGVGPPDFSLDVGSGSHAQQTARVMERLEPVLLEVDPDIVLVPGDVNSTMAAALVACKLLIPVGHIEAGLRSFDRTMPEEINRVVTDRVSDLLFTHSPEAVEHLAAEGVPPEKVHPVGNTMIDTLVAMQERIAATDAAAAHGLSHGEYVVVTLHRPALVDGPLLTVALDRLQALSEVMPVVFPAHPRTRDAMRAAGGDWAGGRLLVLPPLGYVEFLSLVASACAILTDSGGIQEETTFLGVPCFTLRDNTERPVTLTMGTNVLLGLAPERIDEIPRLIQGVRERGIRVASGWDGHAAERMADVLATVPLPARPTPVA